jgi:adenylate cyclase
VSTPLYSNPADSGGQPAEGVQAEAGLGAREIRSGLRAPINHILGYCEMLLEEPGIPASFREDLERVQAGGRQLLHLVNAHFDQSIKGQPPRDLNRVLHDLRSPVGHVVGFCEALQDQANEIGKTQLIPELQKIQDAANAWLKLMEQNLSAIAPAAVRSPESAAAGSADERTAALPGPGELHGVGLTPSHQTAELSTQPAVSTRGAKAAGEPGGALLIVDDDQDDRELLARRFKRQGFKVAVAASGNEAIELIQARKFDLVLLDLVMHGMGGIETLKHLRQRRSMSDLPVIVLTGMDSSADVVEALHWGANDYVTKPAAFAVVEARVKMHLKLKRAQVQLKARVEEVRRLAGALEKRNSFIQKVFGRYVTDTVVQTLLDTPEGLKLGGEKCEVTILMSDLRGFTPLVEGLPAELVIEMLNLYLGEMTQVISRYEGFIDEFIGDGILTIFGAPIRSEDHAERAVACALEMQLVMARVNERLQRLGTPSLVMGIGINTGEVVVGNIGSTKRAKYGVVGSPVNVAARIQAAALAGQVLITESTASHLGSKLSYSEKKLLAFKGITEPLTLYIIDGIGGRYNLRSCEGS